MAQEGRVGLSRRETRVTKAQEGRESLGDKDLDAGVFLERSPGEVEKWIMRSEAGQAHMAGPRVGGRKKGAAAAPSTSAPPATHSWLATQVLPTWPGSPTRGQQSRAGQPQLCPSATWIQGHRSLGGDP